MKCHHCFSEEPLWVWCIPQTLYEVLLCKSCYEEEVGFTPEELGFEEYPDSVKNRTLESTEEY